MKMDKKGRNFLHTAVSDRDLDSVFFLISIGSDVNSTTCDGQQMSPLHLAVKAGAILILRNLVGAKYTCLVFCYLALFAQPRAIEINTKPPSFFSNNESNQSRYFRFWLVATSTRSTNIKKLHFILQR